MKSKMIAIASILFVGLASQAYVGKRQVYYCTVGNPFTMGVSKKFSFDVTTDTQSKLEDISGYVAGKEFNFSAVRSKADKDGIVSWSSKDITVKIQLPGPYDGLQDSIWGQISTNGKSKSLNCFQN